MSTSNLNSGYTGPPINTGITQISPSSMAIGGSSNNITVGASNSAVLVGTSNFLPSSANYIGLVVSSGVSCFAGCTYSYTFGSGHYMHGLSHQFAFGSANRAMRTCAVVLGANAVSLAHYTQTYASGAFASEGDCQNERYVLRAVTTNATTAELLSDGSGTANSQTNRVALQWGYDLGTSPKQSNVAFAYEGLVIARRNGGASETAAWKIQGLIVKDATTVSFVGTPTLTQIGASTGATSWALNVSADTGTNCLLIQGTGEAGKTIRWAANINLIRVAG